MLLALLDQAGGQDAVNQLGAFWKQVEEGKALEAVASPCSRATKEGLEGALERIDQSAPEEVKQWLSKHATGEDGKMNVGKAVNKSVDLLNSDAIVAQVQDLVGQGAGVLDQLGSLKDDGMFQAALAALTSEEMESKLVKGIEELDPEQLVQDAELAMTDQAARQRLVGTAKDACLDFLLEYLPSMPVPPIDGEHDMLEYSIKNLDLSGFHLRKEDVTVTLGDLTSDQSQPVLAIEAANISAQFTSLQWSYKQKYFPYLEGSGSADAHVSQAAIQLSLQLRRQIRTRKGKSGGGSGDGEDYLSRLLVTQGRKDAPSLIWEPVLMLSDCKIAIPSLELEVKEDRLSWVYNVLASLFRSSVREYVMASLHSTIEENADALLSTINSIVQDSWPAVVAATGAELENLPLLESNGSREMGAMSRRRDLFRRRGGKRVRLELAKEGPLGLHLDISTKRSYIRFSGVVEGGQAVQPVEELEKEVGALAGAFLVGVDDVNLSNKSVAEALVLIKQPIRPKVLTFVLPAPKLNSDPGQGNAGGAVDLSPISVEFRSVSLGLRLIGSRLIPQLVEVTGFAKAPDGSMLPAEACQVIEPGMLLLSVNGAELWGMPLKQVAITLRDAALATEHGAVVRLAFLPSPMVSVRFRAPPSDMILAKVPAPGDRQLTVVTGFQPSSHAGPVERTGLVLPGDTLLSANDLVFPGSSGDLHVDLQDLARLTFPASFTFRRASGTGEAAGASGGDGDGTGAGGVDGGDVQEVRVRVDKLEAEDQGRLWMNFVLGKDGRPVLSRFSRPAGPGAEEQRVRPGMVLQAVGQKLVEREKWTAEQSMEQVQSSEYPANVLTFLDMELLFAIQRIHSSKEEANQTKQESGGSPKPGKGQG